MSPLPEDAPLPLGDITELTEVHSLIHTSLPEDIVHGKRKVRTMDGLPPWAGAFAWFVSAGKLGSDLVLALQGAVSLGCRLGWAAMNFLLCKADWLNLGCQI